MQDFLYTIIQHGQHAAKGWQENSDNRDYWKGRYFGLQSLYAEVLNRTDAYSDFNNHCGVYVENGDITEVDENQMTEFE